MKIGDCFGNLQVLAIAGPPPGKRNGVLTVRCTCGQVKTICRTAWEAYKSCGCQRYTHTGMG